MALVHEYKGMKQELQIQWAQAIPTATGCNDDSMRYPTISIRHYFECSIRK